MENDRNFALDDYEKQQLYYVVEANDIINKARHDLTARELKLMDFVISKIMPDDDKFHVIKTSMYELTKVLNIKQNGKNYADMAKTIGELRKKEVLIHDEEERTITQTGWVQSAKYHENGQVEIELSPNLAPHLLGLKNNYTQHLLLDTTKLKSRYSILLYKLMRECDRDNGKSIAILQGTPDEFREWLGAPKSYTYGQFKDKILKPAVEEINLKLMIWTWKFFKADIIVKLFKLKYITTGQLSNLNKKRGLLLTKKARNSPTQPSQIAI